MSRPRAEMIPAVTVPPRPNGLPMATTQSPTRILSESPKPTAVSGLFGLDLEDGDVCLGVAADHLRFQAGIVLQDHRYFVGVLNDMVVGDHISFRIDDEPGAQRGGAPLLAAGLILLEELLEKILERRPRRHRRHFDARLTLDNLSGRNIDHRRKQLFGQVGERLRRRPRLCHGGRHRHSQPDQRDCQPAAEPRTLRQRTVCTGRMSRKGVHCMDLHGPANGDANRDLSARILMGLSFKTEAVKWRMAAFPFPRPACMAFCLPVIAA